MIHGYLIVGRKKDIGALGEKYGFRVCSFASDAAIEPGKSKKHSGSVVMGGFIFHMMKLFINDNRW